MDPITLITFSASLIKAGVSTYEQIAEVIRANRGEMTDEQLDAVLEAIAADDDKRAELAEKIADGLES